MLPFSKRFKSWKSLLYLLAGTSLALLLLIGLVKNLETERVTQNMTDQIIPSSSSISNVTFHSDIVLEEIKLSLVVETNQQAVTDDRYYIGFSIIGPTNDVIDFPVTPVIFEEEITHPLSLSYVLNELGIESFISGSYQAIVALWDSHPTSETSTQLARVAVENAFRLYNTIEHIKTIDKTIWYSRDGQLGRSQLKNGHVGIIDDHFTITLPADTLEGGEIQTIDLKHYGSYEISMQLPNAPSSITGFFLYAAPDFYHEIDIELFNQPDSKVLLTSYLDGSTYHEVTMDLDFDPTADFHRYRIDYYPNRVTFFIDGSPVNTWEDGFSHEPMHLMVNSWFPNWLAGTKPEEDQALRIEWIKY